jgi:hypothetical protein
MKTLSALVTEYAMTARVLLCAAVAVAVISGRLDGSTQERKILHEAIGAEEFSCSLWLSEREPQTGANARSAEQTMMISWVQGFLDGATGMGHIFSLTTSAERREEVSAAWTVTQPDRQTIRFWLDKHCRKYPRKSLNDASLALVVSLLPKKE